MINFFRKIRKKLLTENKFSKYLLYAIGEIILVVIGILIALSINNKNEQNKNKLIEIKILSELRNDLKFNYREVSGIRNSTIDAQNKTDSLIEILNKKSFDVNIHTKLLQGMNSTQYGIFNNSNTTYKFIESNGFKILSNDSIRLSISEMYTKRLNNITYRETLFKKFVEENIWPYVITNFDLRDYNYPIPLGLKLFSDIKFINLLSKKMVILNASVRNTGKVLNELEVLIQEIEREITRLKN